MCNVPKYAKKHVTQKYYRHGEFFREGKQQDDRNADYKRPAFRLRVPVNFFETRILYVTHH
jgi:hypothetical protein